MSIKDMSSLRNRVKQRKIRKLKIKVKYLQSNYDEIWEMWRQDRKKIDEIKDLINCFYHDYEKNRGYFNEESYEVPKLILQELTELINKED